MLDTNTRTIQLTIECPICAGNGRVSVPSHDGSTDRGYSDPSGAGMSDIDCGCMDGQLQITIKTRDVEELIAEAISDAVVDATRPMAEDDRDFLRDDVDEYRAASALVSKLVIR